MFLVRNQLLFLCLINQKCIVTEITKDDNWFIRLLKFPFQIYYRSPIYYHHCDVYIENLLKLSEWNVKYYKLN